MFFCSHSKSQDASLASFINSIASMTKSFVILCMLQIVAVLSPCVVFVAVYLRRRDVYDLHHAILGILYAVFITGMITDALKDMVGRPRPDFFWRCFPDGREVYDTVTARAVCHGKRNMIKDGHKSFPGGHASWSFAGLGFFSWYVAGKIQAFDRRGHIAKLCIVLLPLLVASLVSISLVNDYLHHWGDIFGGGLLGIVIGSSCYLQFFPPPYHIHGWGPHAYFQALAETRNNAQTSPQTADTGTSAEQAGMETSNISSQHEGEGEGEGESSNADHGSWTVDMDDGRREVDARHVAEQV